MNNLINILRSKKGESLVESLVAFLVIVIILLAFTTLALFGSRLNSQAAVSDHNVGSSMTQVGTGTAKIDGTDIGTVTISGNDAGIYRMTSRMLV